MEALGEEAEAGARVKVETAGASAEAEGAETGEGGGETGAGAGAGAGAEAEAKAETGVSWMVMQRLRLTNTSPCSFLAEVNELGDLNISLDCCYTVISCLRCFASSCHHLFCCQCNMGRSKARKCVLPRQ